MTSEVNSALLSANVDGMSSMLFMLQLIFYLHKHTLLYPKTKEKEKLPDIKINYNIHIDFFLQGLQKGFKSGSSSTF